VEGDILHQFAKKKKRLLGSSSLSREPPILVWTIYTYFGDFLGTGLSLALPIFKPFHSTTF
jgi:hypothetical protein